MPTFDLSSLLQRGNIGFRGEPQPQQPDPQVLENQATYQDVLRKWYKQRPRFGAPNWRQQYQAWQGAKPTGKDVGLKQPTLADVLMRTFRR